MGKAREIEFKAETKSGMTLIELEEFVSWARQLQLPDTTGLKVIIGFRGQVKSIKALPPATPTTELDR